jgi:hypothetical protein
MPIFSTNTGAFDCVPFERLHNTLNVIIIYYSIEVETGKKIHLFIKFSIELVTHFFLVKKNSIKEKIMLSSL